MSSVHGGPYGGIYAGLVVVAGALLAPLAAPILSPEEFLRYEAALGLKPPEFEHQNNGPLPQYFADEFGWEDMVREVARIYRTLTPAERSEAAIFSTVGATPRDRFLRPQVWLAPSDLQE